ncbi:LamG-like jellyroll fold domain-containing protein [Paenibacillus sp. MBLB4367]|uniref:LamG-like jellyroll fold domain-containing protein n=1 Tax=Paenibacillus sp. MBLB4367 TaxID=3384767 RepID=UPI0039080572
MSLRNGLVAEYLFHGNANDSSGNGIHGRVEGAVLTSDRFGQPNCAYAFDGEKAFIEISPPPLLSREAFSISVWARYDEKASLAWWNNAIVSQDDGGKNKNKDNLRRVFQLSALGPTITWHRMKETTDAVSKSHLKRGVWYHITAVFDGAFHKLYINGELHDTQAGTLKPHPEEPIFIGKKNTNEKRFLFHGVLDDIRLYNRVLSEQEITSLYTENGYTGTMDENMQQGNESKDEKVMEAGVGYREYKVIGIRHCGLFSEYGKIVPQAVQILQARKDEIPGGTGTEVILYEPIRGGDHIEGYFYTGYLVTESAADIPEGMDYFHLSGHYASVTGDESRMGELYGFLDGWIRNNQLQKDWPNAFIIEKYDQDQPNQVEICMKIRNQN